MARFVVTLRRTVVQETAVFVDADFASDIGQHADAVARWFAGIDRGWRAVRPPEDGIIISIDEWQSSIAIGQAAVDYRPTPLAEIVEWANRSGVP